MTMPDSKGLASYVTGILTTLFGAFTVHDFAVVVGIACTIGAFIVNWIHQKRRTEAQVRAEKAKADHYNGGPANGRSQD